MTTQVRPFGSAHYELNAGDDIKILIKLSFSLHVFSGGSDNDADFTEKNSLR